MTNTTIDLSLILACYNEAEIFEENVPKILEILDAVQWNYEVIFVEDGSQDRTRELLEKFARQHPTDRIRCIFHNNNQGRGAAVSDGFKAASGKIVGFIDIDLEVGPEHILSCWLAVRDGADIAVGHRIYRLYWHSIFRHILSRGYSKLVHSLLALPYHDTESGYKFFRREVILDLLNDTRDPGWFWDTEIMASAHSKGYRIQEISCLFQRRGDKTSTVRPFHDAYVYLRRLWQFYRKSHK